jgi:hypothetical protein
VFSGATAAAAFRDLAERAPDTRSFVLLGAVHVSGVSRPTIYATTAACWQTPIGSVSIDADLASAIRDAARELVDVGGDAHEDEHSLEVEVPFVAHLFPDAKLVPIAVPPAPAATALGARLAEVLRAREAVAIVASSDLTHYGPRYRFTPHGRGAGALDWVKRENDAAIVDRMAALDADAILPMARERQNACGAGAIAAALAAARGLGAARGDVLAYTTSADARPDLAGREDFVGYVAVTASCPS